MRPCSAKARRNSAQPLDALRVEPVGGLVEEQHPGSPSSAAASESRWLMPSENPFGPPLATLSRPTMAITSSTRAAGMPLAAASIRRWLRARRVGWKERASSTAPTVAAGGRSSR